MQLLLWQQRDARQSELDIPLGHLERVGGIGFTSNTMKGVTKETETASVLSKKHGADVEEFFMDKFSCDFSVGSRRLCGHIAP